MATRLGVDVGGTFTDLALMNSETGEVWIGKVLTTPSNPSDGVLLGIQELLDRCGLTFQSLGQIVHATTLVANTLIERTGARVAFIATDGFIDCLDTGVENRYDLFDLYLERPTPYVRRRLRFGLSERTAADGARLRPVNAEEVTKIAVKLREAGIDSVAVCLLHAYRNPAAEREVRDLLAAALPGILVTLSSDVAPEIREYHRAWTAVANAYVQPLVDAYLADLEARLSVNGTKIPLFVMLSEGGIGTAQTARQVPIRLVESGPAAGAIAAASIAKQCDLTHALAFDMGGTTAKLCMIVDGEPLRAYTTEVARLQRFKRGSGVPLKIPVIELIEIGVGGGSIAHFDSANLLRVGPRSAGAQPGPACYGLGGTAPTVTDADLVAGYLDPERFLGGRMVLDRDAAERALADRLGRHLGGTVQEAAVAVQQIVDENMALAARIHAVEHGEDPRRYTLIAFGGAGPGHAWRVADILKLRKVVVPPAAGVTSAAGLLVARPSIELSSSYVARLSDIEFSVVGALLDDLRAQACGLLERADVPPDQVQYRCVAECRYVGQAYEVQVPLPPQFPGSVGIEALTDAFETRYRALFGRLLPNGQVEALTWRVLAFGQAFANDFRAIRTGMQPQRPKSERKAYFPKVGYMVCEVYDRYTLKPGDRFDGPAIIEEDECTTIVGPGATAVIDDRLNIVMHLP